jgi:hypothetical protein
MYPDWVVKRLIKDREKEEITKKVIEHVPDWAWAEWIEEQGIGE